MDEKLTTLVKQALKKAGLDEELAKDIKITNESEIEAEVEKLKGKVELTPEQLKEAIKKAGLEESFNKHLQSETDRRVSQAIATHDLKLSKEKEEAAAKVKADEEKNKKQANMSETEKTISNLTEEVKSLTSLVRGLGESTVKTKRETLIKDSLKKAGLNEGLSRYITVDKDEDIEGSVKSLKDDMLGLKQTIIDEKLKDGEPPAKGEAAGNINEELIGKVASGEGTTAETFEGKKLIEEK